jgi:hypothetical protein
MAIDGQMMEEKGVGRRRRIQLLDDLGNRRSYWKLTNIMNFLI